MPSEDRMERDRLDAGLRPKNLPPKAWDSNKPPGGEWPNLVEMPKEPQLPQNTERVNPPKEKG